MTESGHRSAIVLDGRLDPDEWAGAAAYSMTGGYGLLVKRAGPDLFLAVRYPQPATPSVDLYVDTPTGLVNMHASAQLGQRVPAGAGWTDWAWGNNSGWVSHSTARDPATRRYVPHGAREFRISRSMLPGGNVRVRVVVEGDGALRWPAGAAEFDTAAWISVPIPAS